MQDESEKAVLFFLKNLDFPGIRFGEGNNQVCDYLKSKGYKFTPDLVAGPENIEDAPIEGLFFVEVIQPTSELLFQSEFYENLEFDIPKFFKNLLTQNNRNEVNTTIDMLPNIHQDCYLKKINKKLDKYAHQRKYVDNSQLTVTANLGIVHHFNIGKVEGKNISNAKGLITLLDYFRFYKRLASSDNMDLKNAEVRLLKDLINDAQSNPSVQIVGRFLETLPCLFLMLHVSVEKNNSIYDLAIMVLNTSIIDKSNGKHPVHKWFTRKIFHPRTKKYCNDNNTTDNLNITISDQIFTKS